LTADHNADDFKAVALSLQHARKYFGAVHALEDATITLRKGEAHALVGENGAGKSTLVKILAGVHVPDSGVLEIRGQQIRLNSTREAIAAGVAVIYQEPTLFPDLSIAENVFMERQPTRRFGRIDYPTMERSVEEILAQLGIKLDPRRLCLGLSIAEQQIVEIAKALSLKAEIVIMDEPTAALSSAEVDRLLAVIESLKRSNVAIMFISHRLEEVYRICKRVTVMRDGRYVLSDATSNVSQDQLVRAMVGRDLEIRSATSDAPTGAEMLKVEHLTEEGVFSDVSFSVRAGEVVALAGLVGAGRTEVATAIFGIRRYDFGAVTVGGKRLRRGAPLEAMRSGIGLVPEDRRQQGLVMEMSIARNVGLGSMKKLSHFGLLNSGRENSLAQEWGARLQLKYGRIGDSVETLSGGNQQKVVLAKWLARSPKVLIVDEPTRGIDVGTKAEVHRLILELARQGVAVLVISSELPEVLALADRIVVMREGRLVREFARKDATEELIVEAATVSGGVAA
jgi:rhamnose transport system ATP-binding protein